MISCRLTCHPTNPVGETEDSRAIPSITGGRLILSDILHLHFPRLREIAARQLIDVLGLRRQIIRSCVIAKIEIEESWRLRGVQEPLRFSVVLRIKPLQINGNRGGRPVVVCSSHLGAKRPGSRCVSRLCSKV